VGQSGSDDDDGQAALADLVARRTQGGDVVRCQVLHLVDEDRHTLAEICSEAADVGQQLDQVDLDVPGVGPPRHRGHVDPGVPAIADPRGRLYLTLREGLDDTQDVVDLLSLGMTELAHRDVKGGADRSSKPLVRARLELAGAPVRANCR